MITPGKFSPKITQNKATILYDQDYVIKRVLKYGKIYYERMKVS